LTTSSFACCFSVESDCICIERVQLKCVDAVNSSATMKADSAQRIADAA
jgi:hypothetical protein